MKLGGIKGITKGQLKLLLLGQLTFSPTIIASLVCRRKKSRIKISK
jgi:hypothetical protein